MPAIVTAILDAIAPAWTFVVDTFIPADAASVTLVHVGLWAPMLMGFVFTFLSLVRRGGGRRR